MIRSLISALAGLIAVVIALPLAGFAAHTFEGYSIQLLGDCLLLGSIWVFPVWLLVLWPLYVSVPYRSDLWRPYISIPCGVLAGGILIAVPLPVLLDARPHPYFYVGPFVGGVTFAVGCCLKGREHRMSP